MDKDRKTDRKPLKVYLNVFNEKTGDQIGYLVDITQEGFLLTNENPINAGETFQLKVELPAEIEGTKEFSFSATSMWSDKDSESDFYNSGFQFDKNFKIDVKIIQHLIEKYCFKS